MSSSVPVTLFPSRWTALLSWLVSWTAGSKTVAWQWDTGPQRSSPFSFFFWCGLKGRSNYAKIRVLIIICKWGSCSEEAIIYWGKVWIDWLWVWEEPCNCHPSSIRLLDLANVLCDARSEICKTHSRNPVLINVSMARHSPLLHNQPCSLLNVLGEKYSATGSWHRLLRAALDVLQDVS